MLYFFVETDVLPYTKKKIIIIIINTKKKKKKRTNTKFKNAL